MTQITLFKLSKIYMKKKSLGYKFLSGQFCAGSFTLKIRSQISYETDKFLSLKILKELRQI